MNELKVESSDLLLGYQTQRLQDLIEEILQCCKERASYLASKFDISEAELRCLMLFGAERYVTAKGISQRLHIAKSRVTKIIDGLIQKNWLKVFMTLKMQGLNSSSLLRKDKENRKK
jgi:predicted HTH transcriptional regulator